MLLNQNDGLPTPRRYWAIIAVSLGAASAFVDTSIIIVALPTIARDLGVSGAVAISIVAVYQLIVLATLLPFAALGDRIGHVRLYKSGQLCFLAASILCFFAPNLELLLAGRAIQAAGAAAALSVSMALLRNIYPIRSLGRGLGMNGVVIATAGALAPSLGGLIVAMAGWRYVFVATTPFLLLSLALNRTLPLPTMLRSKYDWIGALFYAGTLATVSITLNVAAYVGHALTWISLLVVAAVLVAAFVRREARREEPILPVDLLTHPVLALSAGSALAAFVGSMAMTLSLPFLLELRLGARPAEIGAVMMAWPLAMIISAPIAGAFADRLPHGVLGTLGMTISCGAYLLVAISPTDASHADLVLRVGMCGLGLGIFVSPNARQIVAAAPRTRTAAAGGIVSTTRILGQTTGTALVALLLRSHGGPGAAPALVAAGFALLAALLSLAQLLPTFRRTAIA